MGDLADKRLRDFVPTIDAYRPVALTVAAILGLVLVLPGADRDAPSSSRDLFATPVADDAGTAATDGRGSEEAAAPSAPAPGGAPVAPVAGPSPVPSPRGGPSTPAPAPVPAADPPRRAPVAPPSPPDADGGDDGAELRPIQIVASGWASSTGGSPVATAAAEGVPDGSLPVGTRVGQADKVSFVRLSGASSALVLGEDASGRRGNAFEEPPVRLCAITEEGWAEGEGQAMADAPAYDAESCVPAQQRGDGTWSFPLSSFEIEDPRGFALVPSAEAPLDFQITFAGQPVS